MLIIFYTQLNDQKLLLSNIIILFNINHLFVHSEVVASIGI